MNEDPVNDLVEQYADFCFRLRQDGRTADDVPALFKGIDMRTGYAVQDRLVQKLLTAHDTQRFGYKIGCTSVAAQQMLNTDTPVYGQMISAWHFTSPLTLPAANYTMLVIEPEFAFTVAADVPDGTYDADTIRPFVANVMPSIEIVHHRLGGFDRFDAPTLAADNAIHGGWVNGTPYDDWQTLDFPNLEVKLTVAEQLERTGRGYIVLGSPLKALAWIANTLPEYGHRLSAGDVVTTGVCMDVYLAQAGQTVRADFGILGEVLISFD